jgi:hypothetical protein
LQNGRWYASNAQLPDGTQIVVGGRGIATIEYVPANGRGTTYIPLIANVRIFFFFILFCKTSRSIPAAACMHASSSHVLLCFSFLELLAVAAQFCTSCKKIKNKKKILFVCRGHLQPEPRVQAPAASAAAAA